VKNRRQLLYSGQGTYGFEFLKEVVVIACQIMPEQIKDKTVIFIH